MASSQGQQKKKLKRQRALELGGRWEVLTVAPARAAQEGRNPLAEPLRGVRLKTIMVDAAFGIALFKVGPLSGR